MLSRAFLILAGLFIGLWLRGTTAAITEIGWPSLALLALLLAIAAAPRTTSSDVRSRLEEACRNWLDALHQLRTANAPVRVDAAGEALRSAMHGIILLGNDRLVRLLHTAMKDNYSPATLTRVILEMRRSIGRPSITLRPAELEALLGDLAPRSQPQQQQSRFTEPASFLS